MKALSLNPEPPAHVRAVLNRMRARITPIDGVMPLLAGRTACAAAIGVSRRTIQRWRDGAKPHPRHYKKILALDEVF